MDSLNGGRRWRRLLAGAATLALALSMSSSAWAQSEGVSEYSLDVYLALQSRADASYELMTSVPEGSESRTSFAEAALADRVELVRYLGSWARSGELPEEMVESAYETRLVLYQNIVVLHSELGRCDDAWSVAQQIDTLANERGATPLGQNARLDAWAEVDFCEDRRVESASTPEPGAGGAEVLVVGGDAQESTYSLYEYLQLQARATRTYERMQSEDPGSPVRSAFAEAALDDRVGLATYLEGWISSGTMPTEMVESARETDLVLLQNIVAIQVELGRCDAARSDAERIELQLEEFPSELADQANTYAWAEVGHCRAVGGTRNDPSPGSLVLVTEQSNTEGDRPSDTSVTSRPPNSSWIYPTSAGLGLLAVGMYWAMVPLGDANDEVREWNAAVRAGEPVEPTLGPTLEDAAHQENVVATSLVTAGTAAVVGGVLWWRLSRRSGAGGPQVTALPSIRGLEVTLLW